MKRVTSKFTGRLDALFFCRIAICFSAIAGCGASPVRGTITHYRTSPDTHQVLWLERPTPVSLVSAFVRPDARDTLCTGRWFQYAEVGECRWHCANAAVDECVHRAETFIANLTTGGALLSTSLDSVGPAFCEFQQLTLHRESPDEGNLGEACVMSQPVPVAANVVVVGPTRPEDGALLQDTLQNTTPDPRAEEPTLEFLPIRGHAGAIEGTRDEEAFSLAVPRDLWSSQLSQVVQLIVERWNQNDHGQSGAPVGFWMMPSRGFVVLIVRSTGTRTPRLFARLTSAVLAEVESVLAGGAQRLPAYSPDLGVTASLEWHGLWRAHLPERAPREILWTWMRQYDARNVSATTSLDFENDRQVLREIIAVGSNDSYPDVVGRSDSGARWLIASSENAELRFRFLTEPEPRHQHGLNALLAKVLENSCRGLAQITAASDFIELTTPVAPGDVRRLVELEHCLEPSEVTPANIEDARRQLLAHPPTRLSVVAAYALRPNTPAEVLSVPSPYLIASIDPQAVAARYARMLGSGIQRLELHVPSAVHQSWRRVLERWARLWIRTPVEPVAMLPFRSVQTGYAVEPGLTSRQLVLVFSFEQLPERAVQRLVSSFVSQVPQLTAVSIETGSYGRGCARVWAAVHVDLPESLEAELPSLFHRGATEMSIEIEGEFPASELWTIDGPPCSRFANEGEIRGSFAHPSVVILRPGTSYVPVYEP